MKSLFNYILKYYSRIYTSFVSNLYKLLWIAFIPQVAHASEHKTLVEYLTDNLVFAIIYNGGWYSLAIIVVVTILSFISKAFKEVFLSIFFAICGVFLIMLLYEAYQDFRWIPEAAEDY